jgi:uncharacterized protein (TIGR03435 family)
MDVGALLRRYSADAAALSTPVTGRFSFAIEQVSEPFTSTVREVATPGAHTGAIVPVLIALWSVGFVWLVCRWTVHWRRIRASVRTASSMNLPIGCPVKSSPAFEEPGVFGIVRPVLLLPDGILDCLAPLEMDAILAHELCHIRRRDNLVTAMHMAVESLFWFHPLVWWVGARLMEERERACDEDVLQTGGDPHAYAEGILKICEFYLVAPLACVAGVTGANLKGRIQAILSERIAADLTFARKVFLAATGLAALAAPLVFGMISARPARAQVQAAGANPPAFEVASVKPNKSGTGRFSILRAPGGGFTATNATLKMLIRAAYGIQDHQLVGGPSWLDSERYDIVAKAPPGTPDRGELGPMLRTLLADRFKVQIHRETRQMPVYALVLDRNGPKFKEVKREARDGDGDFHKGRGHLTGQSVPISDLAEILSGEIGFSVLERTGLSGLYDLKLEWTPDRSQTRGPGDNIEGRELTPAPDPLGPSLFTALQEQLGLKLEKQTGPVEILVIDHAERASEN